MTEEDPRIEELLELAREEGLPLALSPQTIIALEDAGIIADPFTAMMWADLASIDVATLCNAFARLEGVTS